MRKIFITGIGTGIGKTVVSAVVTEALNADYWKPLQCGLDEETDTEKVKRLISNTKSVIHPEAYRLKMPASPHAAAAAENISLRISDIIAPETSNYLVIEGAGGLMVPLNESELIVDLIRSLNANVIVVIKQYLGSINHSILTLQALLQKNIPVLGVVLNGAPNKESEQAIFSFCKYPVLGRIEEERVFTPEVIKRYADEFQSSVALKSLATKK
ncbi:MAG TPA: dethiobiotin synthase [Bacteroidia bacterium]|jgi:dethiobiotin synthetase|nr:dethiobiotin synthase [Bacteroidia bacterium]